MWCHVPDGYCIYTSSVAKAEEGLDAKCRKMHQVTFFQVLCSVLQGWEQWWDWNHKNFYHEHAQPL